MIEMKQVTDGTSFYTSDKQKIPITFTISTPKSQIDLFYSLLQKREEEITNLTREYYDKIAWNTSSNGHGKNWPIFGKIERVLKGMQNQTGIVDT